MAVSFLNATNGCCIQLPQPKEGSTLSMDMGFFPYRNQFSIVSIVNFLRIQFQWYRQIIVEQHIHNAIYVLREDDLTLLFRSFTEKKKNDGIKYSKKFIDPISKNQLFRSFVFLLGATQQYTLSAYLHVRNASIFVSFLFNAVPMISFSTHQYMHNIQNPMSQTLNCRHHK